MTAPAEPREELATILRLVEDRVGLVLRATRWAEFAAVVLEEVGKSGARSGWDYAERLRGDTELFEALVSRLVIGETYFFREPQQVRELREKILPELAASQPETVRVWSAGCASGEEAYSLSVLCSEAGLGDRVDIVGSDLSPKHVARAIAGVYRAWSFRGVDGATLSRYFDRQEDAYRVKDEVRRRVRFLRHNLAADEYPPPVFAGMPVDLILCRNVLIYFDRERARHVGEQLMACLSPGGILVTGPSDPMLRCDPPMEALVTPGGLVYRRGRAGEPVQRARPPGRPRKPPFVAAPPDEPRPVAPEAEPFPLSADAFAESHATAVPPPLRKDAGMKDAVAAFSAGDYERTVELTASWSSPEAAILRVRAISNARGTQAAVDECERLLESHRFDVELTYLHATLLLDAGRPEDAYRSARQVVYLDRSLEVGHFLMAIIALRRGDLSSAERAFRHAHRIALARSPDETVPLGDGQRAGALTAVARDWLSRCESPS